MPSDTSAPAETGQQGMHLAGTGLQHRRAPLLPTPTVQGTPPQIICGGERGPYPTDVFSTYSLQKDKTDKSGRRDYVPARARGPGRRLPLASAGAGRAAPAMLEGIDQRQATSLGATAVGASRTAVI